MDFIENCEAVQLLAQGTHALTYKSRARPPVTMETGLGPPRWNKAHLKQCKYGREWLSRLKLPVWLMRRSSCAWIDGFRPRFTLHYTTACFTLNVLESVQTLPLWVCVRRSPTSWTGNLNERAIADLIGGLSGVFRFPHNSFKCRPIFQTGCRVECEIKGIVHLQ